MTHLKNKTCWETEWSTSLESFLSTSWPLQIPSMLLPLTALRTHKHGFLDVLEKEYKHWIHKRQQPIMKGKRCSGVPLLPGQEGESDRILCATGTQYHTIWRASHWYVQPWSGPLLFSDKFSYLTGTESSNKNIEFVLCVSNSLSFLPRPPRPICSTIISAWYNCGCLLM